MRAQLAWWAALVLGLMIQTTLLPHLFPDPWRPDFTRGLVLWLSLNAVPRGGAWYACLAGFAVDGLSGAPPGLTAILRLGNYAVVRPARGILENSSLLFLLGPLAVLSETLVLWMLRALAFTNPVEGATVFAVAWRQAAVEVVTVPLVFLLMEVATGHRTEPSIPK